MGPSFLQGLVVGLLLSSAGWLATSAIVVRVRRRGTRGGSGPPETGRSSRARPEGAQQARNQPVDRSHALAVDGPVDGRVRQGIRVTDSAPAGRWARDGETARSEPIAQGEPAGMAAGADVERLRLALEAGRMGTWDWDIRRDRITWSENLEGIHGIARGGFDGTFEGFRRLVHPDDRDRVQAAIARCLEERSEFEVEFRNIRADGSIGWLAGRGRVFMDEGGTPVRLIGLGIDITARKRAEEELVMQSRVLESMAEGVSLADEEGTILYTNPAEDRIFGYEPSELVGRHVTVQNDFPPEEDARIVEQVIGHLKQRGVWDGERSNRRKDGTTFTTHARITTIERNGTKYFVRVQEDITERKRLAEQLEAERALLDAFFASTPVGLGIVDSDLRFVRVNEAVARTNGVPLGDHLGRTMEEVIPRLWPTLEPLFRRVFETGEPIRAVEVRGETPRSPGGGQSWLVNYDPIRLGGAIVGVGFAVVETTEARRREARLRDAEERYRMATEVVSGVVYDYDLASGRVERSSGLSALLGFHPEETEPTVQWWTRRVEPGDRAAADELFRRAVAGRSPIHESEYRVRHRDGSWRCVWDRARLVYDGQGRVVRMVGCSLDITERKDAEELLRASEENHRFLAEGLPQIICVCDSEGRFEYINARWFEYSGLTFTQAQEGGWVNLLHPDDRDGMLERWRLGIASARPFEVEYRLRRASDGAYRWHVARARPVAGPGGMIRWVVAATDVDDLKRSQESLRSLSQRLTSLVDNTPLAVVEWDRDFRIARWSGQAEEVFGWPAAEVCGKRIDEARLVFDADQASVDETMRQLTDGHHRFVVGRNRNWTRAGEVISCEWYNSVLHGADGQMEAVLSLVLDVTERERIEGAVRDSEEKYRFVTNTLPALVWSTLADGTVDFFNERWIEYTGLGSNDGQAQPWVEALHPDDASRAVQRWSQSVLSGEPYEVEYRLRRASDGQYRWFLAQGLPMRDSGGRIIRWFGTCTDIHDRKQAEQDLHEADRRKDEFLATLAHELRNPLAPIRNAAQLLRLQGPEDPGTRWAIDMIDRQVRQMARLLDDLLDVSRITRDKLELRRQRVGLAAVIQGAVEMSRPLIASREHELEICLPRDPMVLNADLTRLAQVFANLLNNAAKYTDPGGRICLAAERRGHEAVVSVRDSGIGIPAEHLPHVFEMFSQVASALDRSEGGLGIGLSLVRGLVEMHGGRVEARSDGPGKGSEFLVRLPLADDSIVEATPEAAALQAGRRGGRRILVVDDNRDSAVSMGEFLRASGHQVDFAYDGHAAVDSTLSLVPDVVILDIGLPGLNGYEACRRIREHPPGKRLILIALTGWGQEADRRKAVEAGFDHHLTKPVDPGTVTRLIDSLLA
jgi:PAS domain S-box-containing protein